VTEPLLPAPPDTRRDRRAGLGYAMVAVAATLFAINGTVSKVILESGLSSLQLSEVRSTGALVGLGLGLALVAPARLRVRARELPFLAVFGIFGLAFVQLFYFLAINRLPIGVALLIQYLAPLLIALYARTFMHERVRARIWVALALALAGLTLVVQLWRGLTLDGRGLAACLVAAVTYALYVLLAEHGVRARDPISLSAYGFLFASLFWAAVQPWWRFPGRLATRDVSLLGNLAGIHLHAWLLIAWMIVLGTIVPFALVVGALRHVSATRAGIIAMLEPVAATVVAWLWLGESLGFFQLFGGFVVLCAIILAQTSR
jgi:drug/metabolite transporter (DMT)-like permease